MEIKSNLKAIFFRTKGGAEPVRNWLKALPKVDKRLLGIDIRTVQFGWPLGMPLVCNLGSQLWEIRSKLSDGKIARTIFFMDSDTMILVNGFIKKTQKTPKSELDLAMKRKKIYEESKRHYE